MGVKAGDDKAVPLCENHHIELHAVGHEQNFFDLYGFDYESIEEIADYLWQMTVDDTKTKCITHVLHMYCTDHLVGGKNE